jgi:hypothetical protein
LNKVQRGESLTTRETHAAKAAAGDSPTVSDPGPRSACGAAGEEDHLAHRL